MDRQKIYYIVIVVCILGTGGILYYGNSSSTSSGLPQGIQPIGTDVDPNVTTTPRRTSSGPVAELPVIGKKVQYSAPGVFPNSTDLDLSVFDSAAFGNLVDYTPLTVSPEEIGRENPFVSY
jgi:hypothetical protein